MHALSGSTAAITGHMNNTKEQMAETKPIHAPSAAPSCLRDKHIRPFQVSSLREPPVFIIQAPRGKGMTTAIGSLLVQMQARHKIDGAIVLTDRLTPGYMGGILPRTCISDKPADKVLHQLLETQRFSLESTPTEPLPRLALALDDVMYTPKMFRSETFQREIKLAKNFNITIIIGTSDATLLPANVQTLATHVLATKCVSTDEPKLLQKRMFTMFESPQTLMETLALCQPHEFLVGLLRSQTGLGRVDEYSQSYKPTYYVKNDDWVQDETLWEDDEEADGVVAGAGGGGAAARASPPVIGMIVTDPRVGPVILSMISKI